MGPVEPGLAGQPAGLGLELGEESSDHADKVDHHLYFFFIVF